MIKSLSDWKKFSQASYLLAYKLNLQRDIAEKLGWNVFGEDVVLKKQELLELARAEEPRPRAPSRLATALHNYVIPTGSSYDPKFTKQIKELRPDWFPGKGNVNENKATLLEMAKQGDKRPSQRKSKLGPLLCGYTQSSNKKSYDPEFTKQIKELRPDWFEDTAEINKQKIKSLALSGKGKPKTTVYYNYTTATTTSYDPEFTKQIKELRPDWFINTSDLKKKEIIDLARSGAARPNQKKTSQGRALIGYLNRDPEFTKQIKELAPHWFKGKSK